jgi:hypothetical protein
MKKLVFFIAILTATSGIIHAQDRFITRGATKGELYLSGSWYCNYGFWSDTIHTAILHVTENGKQLEIAHSTLVDDDSPNMQTHRIMADATPGVLYNVDYGEYGNDRLWFSDDYGKTWELRDEQLRQHRYFISDFEGLIYRGGSGIVYKSIDFGEIFSKLDGASYSASQNELGWEEEEVFAAGVTEPYKGILVHTSNFYRTYTITPIDSLFMFGQMGGFFPDVFRGGLSGEVYVTSAFPNNIYKVSFSADTGYHFRVVYQIEGRAAFMSDRKAGDFYIVNGESIETQQPWGYYTRVCINHYTDYGETLAGTYCHDLTREGVVTAVEDISTGSMSVQVYPNPTSKELRVENGEWRVEGIEIFNLLGKSVGAYPCGRPNADGTMTINVESLPAGMYFVRITTDKGIVTKKVIKK